MTTKMVIGEYRFYRQILGKGGRAKNWGRGGLFSIINTIDDVKNAHNRTIPIVMLSQ